MVLASSRDSTIMTDGRDAADLQDREPLGGHHLVDVVALASTAAGRR